MGYQVFDEGEKCSAAASVIWITDLARPKIEL